MGQVTRTAVSLEPALLAEFDRLIAEQGYDNRSEAIRDLIREKLSERELLHPRTPAVAVVAVLYNHQQLQLPHRLTQLQHHRGSTVVSALHVHLDEDHCLEVVVLRGAGGEVRELGDLLVSQRGVDYGKVFLTSLRGLSRRARAVGRTSKTTPPG